MMRFAPLLLATVCALVLLTGLGHVGYLDWREARDAQVAREMLARREVLTPILARGAHFEKPAPAYAVDALLRLRGADDPLASRRVRAGLALVLIVVTGSIGARLFGARAGILTALVLATSLVVPVASRVDGTQVLASILGWVGAAGLADAVFGRRGGRDMRLLVAYGALAAAMMCAGPFAALWPIGALVLYALLARDLEGLRRARPGPGLVIVLAVALPWYGAMAERHGAAFLASMPFFPYAAEARGPWWSGPMLALSFLVVGFYPWSALLPGAISHASTWWRRVLRQAVLRRDEDAAIVPDPLEREVREENAAHFFVACLALALAPIVVYPGPPMTAALPALPAAALLCGRLLDHVFEDPARLARPLRNAVLLLLPVGTVGSVMLALLAPRVREATPELRFLATVVFITTWLPFLANFMGRQRTAALALALPVALATPAVTLRVLPAMEDWLNARAVAEAMNAVAPDYAPLVVANDVRPSLRVYARHNLVPVSVPRAGAADDALDATLDRLRAGDGMTYVAFRPFDESRVTAASSGIMEILARTPTLVLARVHPL